VGTMIPIASLQLPDTFMASDTDSELANRGKNKEGRHNLRQIGLGLLVSRDSELPLFYTVYPGNRHDSKEFARVIDEMFGVVAGLDQTKEKISVVIDKGMNSEDNFAWINDHKKVYFITTYSTYFAADLAQISLDRFEPVDTKKNRALGKDDRESDQMVVHRTTGEFWGKERTVVVTHDPPTARKQNYTFQSKLDHLRSQLIEMRKKVNSSAPQWRNADAVEERYHRLCERLHVASDCYDLWFDEDDDNLTMSFRKNHYEVQRKRRSFGKNIIVTDNTDWTTTNIVEAHLDRWQVEDRFRQSKDPGRVGTRPVRHWTDGKIRCHLFTCVVALTYVRKLELRLEERGIRLTANKALDELSKLYSILSIDARERKPRRALENSRVRPKPRSYRPWATGSIPVGAYTLSVLEIRSGSNFGVVSGGLSLKLLFESGFTSPRLELLDVEIVRHRVHGHEHRRRADPSDRGGDEGVDGDRDLVPGACSASGRVSLPFATPMACFDPR